MSSTTTDAVRKDIMSRTTTKACKMMQCAKLKVQVYEPLESIGTASVNSVE